MYNRQKTPMLTVEQVERRWLLIDAKGKTLGRLATEIATILQGKHRPDYTPHIDSGDCVIVINADQIKVTGNKEAQKKYRHYTGFMAGLRETPFRVMKEKHPDHIIKHAVRGMLPKTRQGKAQFKRLRVFAGAEHELEAQQPVKLEV